jgi:hypothetical protein
MCVQHRLLVVLGQRTGHLACPAEWIVECSELVDEPRVSLEQLGELLGGQLPR